MANEDPNWLFQDWFRFHSRRWMNSKRVKKLTLSQRGAYIELLIRAHRRYENRIPANAGVLQYELGVSEAEYRESVVPVLEEFFSLTEYEGNEVWYHPVMEEELHYKMRKSSVAREKRLQGVGREDGGVKGGVVGEKVAVSGKDVLQNPVKKGGVGDGFWKVEKLESGEFKREWVIREPYQIRSGQDSSGDSSSDSSVNRMDTMVGEGTGKGSFATPKEQKMTFGGIENEAVEKNNRYSQDSSLYSILRGVWGESGNPRPRAFQNLEKMLVAQFSEFRNLQTPFSGLAEKFRDEFSIFLDSGILSGISINPNCWRLSFSDQQGQAVPDFVVYLDTQVPSVLPDGDAGNRLWLIQGDRPEQLPDISESIIWWGAEVKIPKPLSVSPVKRAEKTQKKTAQVSGDYSGFALDMVAAYPEKGRGKRNGNQFTQWVAKTEKWLRKFTLAEAEKFRDDFLTFMAGFTRYIEAKKPGELAEFYHNWQTPEGYITRGWYKHPPVVGSPTMPDAWRYDRMTA